MRAIGDLDDRATEKALGILEAALPPTLTPRQADILDYIREFIRFHHYPPTVREICDATGLSSTSTVQNHLATLEIKGYITRRHGHANRTIVVVEDWKA